MTVYLPIFTVLTNRLGEPFKERDPNAVDGTNPMRDVTLATILVHVLDLTFKGDEKQTAAEKLRHYELINIITEAEQTFRPAGLLVSDVEMLKDRVFQANFTTQLYGRTIETLDIAIAKSKEPKAPEPKATKSKASK